MINNGNGSYEEISRRLEETVKLRLLNDKFEKFAYLLGNAHLDQLAANALAGDQDALNEFKETMQYLAAGKATEKPKGPAIRELMILLTTAGDDRAVW